MTGTARQAAHDEWTEAVTALAGRVLGSLGNAVTVRPAEHNERTFEYSAAQGVLTIVATDGVAAAVGLHAYLGTECGVSVGWQTQLPLPLTELPDAAPTRRTAELDQSYYLNFVTNGYTSPYWGWAEWEREIDWMALHGVTMPLASTGHEAVLYHAYTRLGLDDATIREFLGGPGFLPWVYMGNLDTLAGPLPSSWIERHKELGGQILTRQRALGMTPVLPAFAGSVPRQLAPADASPRPWQGLQTYFVDPDDPLYARITEEITRSQLTIFGTDGIYAADPFIEMPPVDADLAFPGAVLRETLAGLTAADPQAVLVMQDWPFSYQRHFWTEDRVNAFLAEMPADRVLILDLWGEHDPQWSRFNSFGDKRWFWCGLLNYGGRTEAIGDLQGTLDALNAAKAAPNPPTGVGLSMEGIWNNAAFFELVTDQAWMSAEDVVHDWLPGFVQQRYGPDTHPGLLEAWQGLLETVYNASGVRIFPEQFNGMITIKPSYEVLSDLKQLRSDVEGLIWYQWPAFMAAWDQLIAVAEAEPELAEGPLGHDLVEVGMAVMARVADHQYLHIVEHALASHAVDRGAVDRLLEIFTDLDALVSTRAETTFQSWEDQAASWATDEEERDILVDNARRILTVWNYPESPYLHDYAGRIWGGLVGQYYRRRWELWADGLEDALTAPAQASKTLDEHVTDLAREFLRDGLDQQPTPNPSDLVCASRMLFERYSTAR